MPIDIDRFETTPALRETTSERVIRFLLRNDDRAYTRREIADAIDSDPETVGTNLSRLKNDGIVRHREPYWAFTGDRARAIDTLRERYGQDRLREVLGDDWTKRVRQGRGSGDDERIDGPRSNGDRAETGDRATTERDEAHGSITTEENPHQEAASAFFDRARERLGARIEACYLFGSVAREDEIASSDVDVLVVITDEADYAAVDDRLLDIAYELQLEYGTRVEVHTLRASEFVARKARNDPFVRTVLEEGKRRV